MDPQTNKPAFSYAHPIFWAPFSLIGEGGDFKIDAAPIRARGDETAPEEPSPQRSSPARGGEPLFTVD
jgi:hypothetical protein